MNTNDKAGSDKVNNLSSSNFNSFFVDSVKEVRDVVINSNISKGGISGNSFPYKTSNPKISIDNVKVEEVYQAIFSLRNSEALDVYGLKSSILKLSAVYIVEVLTYLFNMCTWKYLSTMP